MKPIPVCFLLMLIYYSVNSEEKQGEMIYYCHQKLNIFTFIKEDNFEYPIGKFLIEDWGGQEIIEGMYEILGLKSNIKTGTTFHKI